MDQELPHYLYQPKRSWRDRFRFDHRLLHLGLREIEKIAMDREKMEADVALRRMEIEIKAAESATRSAA